MATSKIVNGERLGDPEGDLDWVPSPGTGLGRIAISAEQERTKKRDLLVEKFMNANLGFEPESRSAIAVALLSPKDKIDDIYKKTIKYRDTSPDVRKKQIRQYYKSLTARQSWSRLELAHLTDANSIFEKDRYDPTTFSVGALRSSSNAMEVVAVRQLRASALAQSDWTSLDRAHIERSTAEELDFMSTLSDDELTKRWSNSWESITTEYKFWSSMVEQTEQNSKANFYL